jgi:4-carboxymuconolactone decarboxylase
LIAVPRKKPATVVNSVLDAATAALVRVAAAIPEADEPEIEARVRAGLDAGVATAWLDELVLAGVLFAGFPRGLVYATALRRVAPHRADGGDATEYDRWQDWARRGQATCKVIYGANYQKLRENVQKLHPVLDAWIVVDGYGRILSRPALDLRRRELCSIAMLVPQDTPRQLHSHLRGALNAGATKDEVQQVLDLAATEPSVRRQRLASARKLWRELSS